MNSRYPKYKKTGLDWLEEIPENWEILPNKALFSERKEKNNNDYELLSVTQDRGIIKQSEIESKKDISNDDKSNYKLVLKNDLAYNKMRMWQGAIGHSQYYGLVSPAYVVLKPKENVFSRYFYYLFKSNKYLVQTNKFSYGLCDDMNSLRYEDFRNMVTPVPPYQEQKLLSYIIESKMINIEKYLSSKKKIIDLFRERIGLQTFAGFQSNSLIKCNNWLEQLPSTWKIERSKRIFNNIVDKNYANEQFLAVTQDKGVLPKDLCDNNYTTTAGDGTNLLRVIRNDFVISLRSFQGGIEHSNYQGLVSPAYTVLRLKKDYNNELLTYYYKYFLKTQKFISMLNTVITGIRDGKNINYKDFQDIILPIPSEEDLIKFKEQFLIFENLVTIFEKEKKLFNKFSAALINEVVTGQIDIRNIETKYNSKDEEFLYNKVAEESVEYSD
jgi:type I restriction enzyme S subunit